MIGREELERALEGLGRPRVLIVGDVMLDRYVTGDVTRISPEAPIPVVAARRSEERLGGAGNVGANLRAMEAEVDLVGLVGEDQAGRDLRALLESVGIDTAGIVIDATRPTIRKTRLISGVQQMMRVDWEDPRPVTGQARAAALANVARLLERADAVVLSDYGKGLLTAEVLRAAIDGARARAIPVLVDPKGADFGRYRGATLVTPNRKEAELALGRELPEQEDAAAGARELIEVAGLDAAVITLGSRGILWRTRAGDEGHDPAQARAVFDVTGAGDTVVAHLALYLAGGLDLPLAVGLANHAAGIVVGRLGTNAVHRRELRARLRETIAHEGKVVRAGELEDLLAAWRKEHKRVVFTNGCFDIIHKGHVEYLRFARTKGDVLLVAVNDDESVRRLKGPDRPVNTIDDRMEVLAAMEMVDAVVAFGQDTPAEIIQRVTPDVLVKGEDWADKGVVGSEWVERHGGQVVLAELVPGRSTSDILQRVRQGGAPPAEGGAT